MGILIDYDPHSSLCSTFRGRDVEDDILTTDDPGFRGWIMELLYAINTGNPYALKIACTAGPEFSDAITRELLAEKEAE